MLCETKQRTGLNKTNTQEDHVHTKYGVLEENIIDEEVGEDKRLGTERKGKISKYKYIGEISRSGYERALEHHLSLHSLHTGHLTQLSQYSKWIFLTQK